jgi:hypothetical protein
MTDVYSGEPVSSAHMATHESRINNLEAYTFGTLTQLSLAGYSLQTANIISTNAGGHVETFGASGMVTLTLVAGRTYRAHYGGGAAGTTGDAAVIRLRAKAGATVDAASTLLDGGLKPVNAFATGTFVPVSVAGLFVAPSSAQYTFGVSIDWVSGGANDFTLYYILGTVQPILEVYCVKL